MEVERHHRVYRRGWADENQFAYSFSQFHRVVGTGKSAIRISNEVQGVDSQAIDQFRKPLKKIIQ